MKPLLGELLARHGMTKTDIARQFGINKASITMWEQRRVPADRVLQLEKLTGIPRHELRPDLYPRPKRNATLHPR